MAQHPNMHLCKNFDLNFSAFLKKIDKTFKVSNSSLYQKSIEKYIIEIF